MAVSDDGRRHQISFGASVGNLNAFRMGHIISYLIAFVCLVFGGLCQNLPPKVC